MTEAVTGVDLVRAQLIVAEGGRLPWTQDALSQRGHAHRVPRLRRGSGARVSAAGRAARCSTASRRARASESIPASPKATRVGVNYDPLLAKLIVHAETREAARIARASPRCGSYPVLGTRTNIPFLLRLLELPAFRAGRLHTGMIEEHLAELTRPDDVPPEALAAAALATAPAARLARRRRQRRPTPTRGRRCGRWGR